ncbi:MAG: hypothetical protein EU550_01040 [Promethearchaeota archaeon]|nr:MAG: hypothetical protein EU550_01040 [Candidatus Lokiarchaeota archaeon]
MVEKTELMEEYERKTGKHAIWAGKITKQFIEWKKDRISPEEPIHKEKIENEIILFLALSKVQKPNYPNILEFCTSFGLRSNDVIEVLLKKIMEGEVIYTLHGNLDIKLLIEDLLNLKRINIPLTIKVNEALEIFKTLQFRKPLDVLSYFKSLKKSYPNFISLSSSRLNQREDLITFKQLFPEQVNFKLNNRWAI